MPWHGLLLHAREAALFEYADNLALYACHGQSCTRARTKQFLCKLRCPSTSSLMACHLHASEGARCDVGTGQHKNHNASLPHGPLALEEHLQRADAGDALGHPM